MQIDQPFFAIPATPLRKQSVVRRTSESSSENDVAMQTQQPFVLFLLALRFVFVMLKIFRSVQEKAVISPLAIPRVISRVQALTTPTRGPSAVTSQMKQQQISTPILRQFVSPDAVAVVRHAVLPDAAARHAVLPDAAALHAVLPDAVRHQIVPNAPTSVASHAQLTQAALMQV